jgi:hypothetical protein
VGCQTWHWLGFITQIVTPPPIMKQEGEWRMTIPQENCFTECLHPQPEWWLVVKWQVTSLWKLKGCLTWMERIYLRGHIGGFFFFFSVYFLLQKKICLWILGILTGPSWMLRGIYLFVYSIYFLLNWVLPISYIQPTQNTHYSTIWYPLWVRIGKVV